MLTGIAVPLFGSAASVTIEFLNPLGELIPPANQPLVERLADLNGKTVKFIYYGANNTPSALSLSAMGDWLKTQYPTMTATYTQLTGTPGTMYDVKNAATYTGWANGADAIVFGVIEDNVAAWWIARHAKEIEARGVPTVVVANSWWDTAVKYGAEDNGFAAMRTVSIDRDMYADAYGKATAAIGTTSARATYFASEFGSQGIFNDIKYALTGPLNAAEQSSAPLSRADLGDPGVSVLSVAGTDRIAAMQEFQDLSMAMNFGDGLPLEIPTRAAVNALLATTDRDPDEIIGRIMLRGGLITVEKVAINAVMAGARPEHFPIVLAAMEAYATAWEDNKLFYQPTMANEQATLMLVVSGPAVDELDVGNGRAFDPGAEGEGVLGRAVRLCARNIGHVLQKNSTIINAMFRINDHEMYVIGENNEFLPAGWKTHSEMMGFPAGSNTVTLICTTRGQLTAGSGGGTSSATTFLATHRTALGTAATANAPGVYAINFTQAQMAARATGNAGGMGLTTKEAVKTYVNNNTNASRENLYWPIVAGFGRSMSGRAWHGTATYNTRGFQAQLAAISGDAIPPSAPQDLMAKISADGTKAWLTWNAPDRADGAVTYQVSIDGGANWVDVGTSLAYTANLDLPYTEYIFCARAVNDVRNSMDVVQNGANWALSYKASGRGAWALADIKIEITSIRIDTPAMVSVQRNSQFIFDALFAPAHAALYNDVLWSVSDPSFAIVDNGVITTLNKMGMVVVTAKDVVSGISHSVVLRIS
jgi:hypothetical protein